MIYAGVKGYLDKLEVSKIGQFEQGLLAYMRGEGKAILESIRSEKKITDETEAGLKAAIETYLKNFA